MADKIERVEVMEKELVSDSSSNDGDISDGEEEAGYGQNEEGNQGWANVMNTILKKKVPENKAPVLSKSKRIKREKEEKSNETLKTKVRAMEHHHLLEKDHIIPDGPSNSYEKKLQRIATKGVVKLFNAVSKHQKELESKLKVASTESKKSKVMQSVSKSDFLDILKSSSTEVNGRENNNKKHNINNNKAEHDNHSSSWDILRDDFMMGAKMKDWDREEEKKDEVESLSESEDENEEEIEYEND